MDTKQSQRLPPLTVSQLTNAIKLSLESTFSTIYLQGEITNFKLQTSGHLYFSLKDANAQIAVVMFRAEAASLGIMPKAGDQVLVKGELNVYPPKGNYQLIVRELSYIGLGELLQKLEMLKIKLHQQGWFKATHKKALPRFPKRIGVITSPTGAVIQDILNVLSRRFSGFHLLLNPVKVQGTGAAQEIAQAIEQFNRYGLVDVIIVGRGGGSLEDLWAFNEEIVASAIFHSQLPIISAVGHETDHCIADYVADVRAPTPSAAAEIVIGEKQQHLDQLSILRKRMQQTLGHLIQQNQYRLQGILKHPLISHPHTLLEWRMQRLDDFRLHIDQSMGQFLNKIKNLLELKSQQIQGLQPLHRLMHYKQQLETYGHKLQLHIVHRLEQNRQQIAHKKQQWNHLWQTKKIQMRHRFNANKIYQELQSHIDLRLREYRQKMNYTFELLKAMDPKKLLEKGYSILFAEKSTSVINSIKQLSKGQQAKLVLFDGEAQITINEVSSSEYKSFSRTRNPPS